MNKLVTLCSREQRLCSAQLCVELANLMTTLTHSRVIRRTINLSTLELELTGAGGDEDLSQSLLGSSSSSIIPNELGSL